MRIAFSLFGTVSTAGRSAAADIVVTASAADHQEQALTDADGAYRIRGLKPGAVYTVEVRPDPLRGGARPGPLRRQWTLYARGAATRPSQVRPDGANAAAVRFAHPASGHQVTIGHADVRSGADFVVVPRRDTITVAARIVNAPWDRVAAAKVTSGPLLCPCPRTTRVTVARPGMR